MAGDKRCLPSSPPAGPCTNLARLSCGPGCCMQGDAQASRACCRTKMAVTACRAAEGPGASWKPRQLTSSGTNRQATSRRPSVRQAGSALSSETSSGSRLERSPAANAMCSRRRANTMRGRRLVVSQEERCAMEQWVHAPQ